MILNILLDKLFVIAANAVDFENLEYELHTLHDLKNYLKHTTEYEKLFQHLDYVLNGFWSNKTSFHTIENMFMRKYNLIYTKCSNSLSNNHISSGCLYEILNELWHEKKEV